MLKNQDKPQEFPPDISSNWWWIILLNNSLQEVVYPINIYFSYRNYLSLTDKQPDIEYQEVSDSATTLPIILIDDSEIPTSSVLNSISEMEGADEAEADFEMPEIKKTKSISAASKKVCF
jgi:hypothetical protein